MTEPRDRALLPAAVWFVPAIMLFVALGAMPYGYYVLLRWITCGAFLLLVIQEHRLQGSVSVWLVLFTLLAVLFNPLFPIHLTREVWAPIDVGSAVALVIHFRVARSARGETRSASSRPASAKAATPSPDPPPKAPAREAPAPPEQGADSNTLPAGYRLHEYEIVRVLGAGGFGITYLAFDNNLKGPVAIKEYFYAGLAVRRSDGTVAPGSTQRADDYEWGRTRFLDEAQALTRLDHSNIVRVRRYFPANNTAYIVMDYVEGESLAAFLDRHGTLTPAQWRPWMEALLNGLEHVHRHDYLHRDIKPENIVIRAADSQPVLVDFGAARRAAADKTQHLTAIHTPRYAPIEQYSTTSRQGPFTDIYSLAAVSYRALAGEPPPDAANRILEEECQPVAERITNSDSAWLAGIDGGLAPRPSDRPQNVKAWRVMLRSTRGMGDAAVAPVEASGTDPHNAVAVAWITKEAEGGSVRAQIALGRMYVAGRGVSADTTKAIVWFRKAADQGDPEAQCLVGTMYDQGQGASMDHAMAGAWYRKAADQGYAPAQYLLGVMHGLGQGVKRDYAKALEYYRRAAEQRLSDAQYALGGMYERGMGVAANPVQAVSWYSKAASQGHPLAQLSLGNMYADGTGVPVDAARAVKWYQKAANQGLAAAQLNLGGLYDRGDGVPADAAQAVAWYSRAAHQGNVIAQHNLGNMYDRGEGVQADATQAISWYRRAANEGHAPSQFNLGIMYALGEGVHADAAQSAAWYRRAAEQGHAQSQFNLGNLYLRGDGVPSDAALAASWHHRAAEQNLAEAQFTLGITYSHGEGVSQDFKQAAAWFRRAAEQGHAESQYALAEIYLRGQGVRENLSQAVAWFSRAAAQGHTAAQGTLDRIRSR